jgi:hypothetical protein
MMEWGMGLDGLPSMPACSLSDFFLLMMSMPQNVKKIMASMPIMRAALAMMSPG